MRGVVCVAAAAMGLIGIAAGSSGAVVAQYQADFQTPSPKSGWSYLWNANGPIGNSGNYVPLVFNSTSSDYETATGPAPHPAPADSLAATGTSLTPGQGTVQASDGNARYVIAAFTVSAADIAADGNIASLPHYHFTVSDTSLDGIDARIYVNNTLIIDQPLPPGLDYSDKSLGAYPVPLGNVSPGDTIYVAVGANATDTGDKLGVDYEIDLNVPEPASAGTMMFGGLLLLRRRR